MIQSIMKRITGKCVLECFVCGMQVWVYMIEWMHRYNRMRCVGEHV